MYECQTHPGAGHVGVGEPSEGSDRLSSAEPSGSEECDRLRASPGALPAWDALEQDDLVDVVIITGTGDAFCGGMDLKTHVSSYVGATPQMIADWVKLGLGGSTRGKHRFSKPIIAAVNGWALAGGFELALSADIRIASDRARFGSFEARRGFHHGDGGIARLVNFCGVGIALELGLTAEPIDAARACQINLVSKVVPHAKLMSAAESVARTILRNDQAAVRSMKQVALDMIGRTLDDQLYKEAIAAYTLDGEQSDGAGPAAKVLRQGGSRPAWRECHEPVSAGHRHKWPVIETGYPAWRCRDGAPSAGSVAVRHGRLSGALRRRYRRGRKYRLSTTSSSAGRKAAIPRLPSIRSAIWRRIRTSRRPASIRSTPSWCSASMRTGRSSMTARGTSTSSQ